MRAGTKQPKFIYKTKYNLVNDDNIYRSWWAFIWITVLQHWAGIYNKAQKTKVFLRDFLVNHYYHQQQQKQWHYHYHNYHIISGSIIKTIRLMIKIMANSRFHYSNLFSFRFHSEGIKWKRLIFHEWKIVSSQIRFYLLTDTLRSQRELKVTMTDAIELWTETRRIFPFFFS